ncbi:MAG: DUF4956 domain-containing protein [Gammaproteobacteria bacterium]|nr:DUF4956 domain-containing protein [Gammaproteobacteria bacterium]
MTDNIRIRLFSKIIIYYGICLALVLYAGLSHPEWMQFLPFGGLDVLQDNASVIEEGDLVDQLLVNQRPISLFNDAMNLVSALAGCLIVMIPLRWLYMTDGLKKSWNPDVATSLLVLPLIVTAIVYIVKFSLPLAFALAGIFAGVRYRTSLKSQSDAFFTFACIAVGLSAGTRSLGIGLVMAMFFAVTMLALPPRRGDQE